MITWLKSQLTSTNPVKIGVVDGVGVAASTVLANIVLDVIRSLSPGRSYLPAWDKLLIYALAGGSIIGLVSYLVSYSHAQRDLIRSSRRALWGTAVLVWAVTSVTWAVASYIYKQWDFVGWLETGAFFGVLVAPVGYRALGWRQPTIQEPAGVSTPGTGAEHDQRVARLAARYLSDRRSA